MTVDYNRARCEDFVRRVLKEHETAAWDGALHRLWMCFVEHSVDLSCVGNEEALLCEWRGLSLWNRQQVLFLLVPHITQLATEAAMDCARQARKFEPL